MIVPAGTPAIVDHFKEKGNQKFELKMKFAAELRKDGYDFELKAFEAQASDKEHERLVQHDISINQALVYMALQKSKAQNTYCFFGLFQRLRLHVTRSTKQRYECS